MYLQTFTYQINDLLATEKHICKNNRTSTTNNNAKALMIQLIDV